MVALGSEPSSSVWSKTRVLGHHADYSDSQRAEGTRRLLPRFRVGGTGVLGARRFFWEGPRREQVETGGLREMGVGG